jgi:prepilin-type N-terminal cleavage/methylation domain-containing protein
MSGWAKGQGPRARGNTLVELLVVLAILGTVAGVTGLRFRRVTEPQRVDTVDARIADARREAIRSGKSVTVIVMYADHPMAATAHPDGRVIADTALAIDHLSGRRGP